MSAERISERKVFYYNRISEGYPSIIISITKEIRQPITTVSVSYTHNASTNHQHNRITNIAITSYQTTQNSSSPQTTAPS